MNSIQQIFQKQDQNLLSIFFTAGFPELNQAAEIIDKLGRSGVDFIEVGLPFSDPLADGPTIQHSSTIALKNGMNLDIVFKQLEAIKDTNTTPLVLMGYINQIIKYGEEAFCQKVVDCGIDTLILPDLPMVEYEEHYRALFKKYGLTNVFLITPQTSEERIRKIDELTESFIYMVASSAITGAKGEISQQQIEYFERIKSMNLQSKLIIGFGISDHKTFSKACEYGNGAIIGSAFIKSLDQKGVAGIEGFIQTIKR
ncbi:tryptophan synthase subunit alpha [Tenacibaculum agarivorans]|uniref:tryptophan synthase subunit alpha n=1 Tax=Tenacibaculum agarivorans TaxID=1908389 RepID=UPI00094BA489|nr:tryptophan synthase subunit alpha [Tenacibaculum agarivorans]